MDTLSAMFGGVDLSSGGVAGGESDEELMGMMQSMMESLLSRDVLYPSLQAICKKVSISVFHHISPKKNMTPQVESEVMFDLLFCDCSIRVC